MPLEEMLRKSVASIPAANWLFWVNEIVADVRQRANNTSAMAELIAALGNAFPQQVFPVLRANLDTRKVGERIRKGELIGDRGVLDKHDFQNYF